MNRTPVETLLVEDGDTFAQFMEDYLRNAPLFDYRINRVKTLKDAELLLNHVRYGMVLLDLSLPDAEGLTALVRVRELDGSVPIVIVSGESDDKVIIDAIGHRATEYIVKDANFTQAKVWRTLQQAMARREGWRVGKPLGDAISNLKAMLSDGVNIKEQEAMMRMMEYVKCPLRAQCPMWSACVKGLECELVKQHDQESTPAPRPVKT